MNTQIILDYLSELENNNNREWYHANKEAYKEASQEFLAVIESLIYEIGNYDAAVLGNVPKDLTFKLVRDTRFSKDKSPYNPAFRAHISSRGKLPIPVGYFLILKPGNQTFLGGGLFADMFKDATKMVRDYILQHSKEWEKIITDTTFQKYFKVQGNALKNVPAEYEKSHPQAEYLKYKSWYLEYYMEDSAVSVGETFIKEAAKIFHIMKPFNDLLNKALLDFKMPERPN